MSILNQVSMGNSLIKWTAALAAAVLTSTVQSAARRMVGSRLTRLADKTATNHDNLIADLIRVQTKMVVFVAVAVFGTSLFLDLPPHAGNDSGDH